MLDTAKNTLKRIRTSTLVYAFLAVCSVFLIVSLVAVYTSSPSNAFVNRAKGILPYPIVLIGYRDGITFRTLAQNMVSVKRFYETQDFSKVGLRVDFSTEEGQKRFLVREKEVLNKMIEDKAIEILARDRGIVVSRDEVTQGVTRKLDEYGSGATVKGELERLYGWSLDDFEEKVVMPSLYQEKLQANFERASDAATQAKEKIMTAEKTLQSGQAFAVVAKQYSEGDTAEDGGDLGWFALADLAPELRALVTTQNVGVPGNITESKMGFHIILVEEIKKEETKDLYRLRQIFTRKMTFADFLSEEMKGLSVHVLSPAFEWNRETARVEFRSQEMRDFEKNLYEKFEGDPAFFF